MSRCKISSFCNLNFTPIKKYLLGVPAVARGNQQCLGSAGFNPQPWPRNFHLPPVWPQKMNFHFIFAFYMIKILKGIYLPVNPSSDPFHRFTVSCIGFHY